MRAPVMEEAISSCSWSWDEEKAFENAVAVYTDDGDQKWEKIAEDLPGKSLEEIMHHFQLLEEDVGAIELGLIPLPNYSSLITAAEGTINGGISRKSGMGHGNESGRGSRMEQERKKGIAWTEEEHRSLGKSVEVLPCDLEITGSSRGSNLLEKCRVRLFLLGLEKYGKGDWRSISRNFVVTRTPTQVASHAQKFFIRLNSGNKDRRRSSIHDITTVGHGDDPISAQTNATMSASGNCSSQSSQKSVEPDAYGTAIGHAVVSGLVPAIGTPVTLPVLGARQMAYKLQTPETFTPDESITLRRRSRTMPRKSSRR
ncbi:Transcription factor DIVARICATA [Platanthera guangdongensis]|uniref:Transcription factor DIVARICATA n=1 Tax=Platanthera guangdongensis TaxID=2320717 RepID=A0ABR2MA02_9ASPA